MIVYTIFGVPPPALSLPRSRDQKVRLPQGVRQGQAAAWARDHSFVRNHFQWCLGPKWHKNISAYRADKNFGSRKLREKSITGKKNSGKFGWFPKISVSRNFWLVCKTLNPAPMTRGWSYDKTGLTTRGRGYDGGESYDKPGLTTRGGGGVLGILPVVKKWKNEYLAIY